MPKESNTKKYLDEFYEENPGRRRKVLDTEELYIVEARENTELVEFTEEYAVEFVQLIQEMYFKKTGHGKTISAIRAVVTEGSKFFEWYIEKYNQIDTDRKFGRINPFKASAFSNSQIQETVRIGDMSLSNGDVENAIKHAYATRERGAAVYIECLIRLFHEGISNTKEALEITEDMVDFNSGEIKLPRRTIRMSDALKDRMVELQGIDTIKRGNKQMVMTRINNSVLKIPLYTSYKGLSIEDRIVSISSRMRDSVSDIGNDIGVKMVPDRLFRLGFYNYVCSKNGEEFARRVFTSKWKSKKNIDENSVLKKYADEYGICANNITIIKKQILEVVRIE